MTNGLDTRELAKLSEDMKIIVDHYPEQAKEFLKVEGTKMAKELRVTTKALTKGHRKRTGDEQKKALAKNIRRTAPKKQGDDWQVTVSSKAPHAHLFEEGHVQYKPVPGKGRKHQVKTDQFVEGRHPAAKTATKMAPEIERDAAKLVDEVLRRGGIT